MVRVSPKRSRCKSHRHTLIDSRSCSSRKTQNINVDYLPLYKQEAIVKRTDYGLYFNHEVPEIALARRFAKQELGMPLSHMAQEFSKTVPFYCGVEVKKQGGDANEAMLQLLVWFSAGFQHRRALLAAARQYQSLKAASIAGCVPPPPPLLGFIINGHQWSSYTAHEDDIDGKMMVCVEGEHDGCSFKTNTGDGVFQLLRLIERVKTFGKEIYWLWLRQAIFEPCGAFPLSQIA